MKIQITQKDTIEQMGYNGSGKIRYLIPGYNNETLDIMVDRERSYNSKTAEWKIDLDYPRYGRERDRYPSNILVAEHIRDTLDVAIPEMKRIEKLTDELEKHYQRGETERRIKKEEEERKRQEAIAKDKPVGDKLAKAICDNMVKQARATESDSKEISFKTRGEHKEQKMRCVYTYSGLTLFNLGYYRVSRKDAYRVLADAWLDSVDTGDIKDQIPDARMAAFMMGGIPKNEPK
jgi:hypothetical protein